MRRIVAGRSAVGRREKEKHGHVFRSRVASFWLCYLITGSGNRKKSATCVGKWTSESEKTSGREGQQKYKQGSDKTDTKKYNQNSNNQTHKTDGVCVGEFFG